MPRRSTPLTFKVQIVGLAGPFAELDAELSWSVNDLQRAISRNLGILKREQRLLMGGVLLSGPQKLATLGFAAGTEVTLLKRDPDEAKILEEIAAIHEQDARNVVKLLQHAPPKITANGEVMLCAVRKHIEAAACASEELRSNRDFMLSVLCEGLSPALFSARDFVFIRWSFDSSVTHSVNINNVIPQPFLADHQIMLAAVQRGFEAFQYAAGALRSDRDFVIAVMQCKPPGLVGGGRGYGHFLGAVGQALWSDLEVVIAAVRLTGLEPFHPAFVSQPLRNDVHAMHAIVQVHGLAIQYASEAIRANHEIATAAARQNRWALHHVSAEAAAAANSALKAPAPGDSAPAPVNSGPQMAANLWHHSA